MKCHHCQQDAVYKCSSCGHLLCFDHVRFRTICPECIEKAAFRYSIRRITSKDKEEIRGIVEKFWGEDEQLTFDRRFKISQLPGYVAKTKNKIIAFITTAEIADATLIATLGVLPEYQGSGVGKKLVKKIESNSLVENKKRLLVSTSNDDLAALAFYQSIGFQIFEVRPNVIALKHGKVSSGIGKLPIRDELRLQKTLCREKKDKKFQEL
jgi:ribosomal protein S18 acetylase RimI-like enzyme